MKKFFLILASMFAIVFLALALIPFLFKDKIFKSADNAISNAVNANVFYNKEEITLSIFSNFPNLTLSLGEFGIEGINEFSGDTLLYIEKFEVAIDLMSVLTGDQIKINKIGLIRPNINVIISESGKANYDIAKEEEPKPSESEKSSKFSIGIKGWEIFEGQLKYTDYQAKTMAMIKNLNHQGSGDLTQDLIDISTKTNVESFNMEMGGINYVNKKRLDFSMQDILDLPN